MYKYAQCAFCVGTLAVSANFGCLICCVWQRWLQHRINLQFVVMLNVISCILAEKFRKVVRHKKPH